MPAISRLALVFAIATVTAACGGGEEASTKEASTGDGDGSAPAALQHVDGTLAVEDGDAAVTITPKGGEPVRLTLGDGVAAAEVQAFAASGAPVRAHYRDGTTEAVRIEEAARPAGAKSATGEVASISEGRLQLRVDGTVLDFTIRDEHADAFEVGHLEEHKASGAPITVLYVEQGGTKYAEAYHDA